MKLVLFGATGSAGLLLIHKALAAGHDVVVYARAPAKITATHSRLTVFPGTLSDDNTIAQAIKGADAVISVLGPAAKHERGVLTNGMQSIVAAMKAAGVRRLIATSTPSFRDPRDGRSVPFRLAVTLIKTLQRDSYDDIVGAARVVHDSSLDWTLVRLPMLTDKPANSPPVAGYLGTPGVKVFWLSREVLAEFLLKQLDDTSWMRQAPVISNQS